MTPPLRIQRLPHAEGLPLPSYATAGAAGMDLMCATTQPVHLIPGARKAIPTGLRVAVPPGYEMQVRSRSGFALRDGVTVLNSPGTIDEDYRGEVQVILINQGSERVTINRGDRIAQAVIAPVVRMPVQEVETLDETERGEGGFGSTGR